VPQDTILTTRAGFLLYNGLTAGQETPIPDALYTEIVATCYQGYREMSPIHTWLRAMTQRAQRS
jgi:hypothetical protein